MIRKNVVFYLLIALLFTVSASIQVSNEILWNNKNINEFGDYVLPEGMLSTDIQKYYLKNNILPGTASEDASIQLTYSGVNNHLQKRFGGGIWSVNQGRSKSVRDIYLTNPKEVYEWDDDIQTAKRNANNTKKFIGCGPIALYCQLDYLIRAAGYYELGYEPNSSFTKIALAQEVISNVSTISSESWIGELVGASEGTFTFPSSFIDGANKVLNNHGLAIKKTEIGENGKEITHYTSDSQIYVHGDTIPNLSFFNTKINKIKQSIDRGMPVVWWTTSGAGDFRNHYMNIFGYEEWETTDGSGKNQTHLMFKLRFNWGIEDVYMDSDTLNAVNGGFIFFDEKKEHVGLNGEDYGFECAYNNKVEFNSFSKFGHNFATSRFRTGFVKHYTNGVYDSSRLTLSSTRNDNVNAYLAWHFDKPITKFSIGLSKWSLSEWPSNKVEIKMYYSINYKLVNKDIDVDELKTSYENPVTHNYEFTLDDNIDAIEIYITSYSSEKDRNKGRLVISGVSITY